MSAAARATRDLPLARLGAFAALSVLVGVQWSALLERSPPPPASRARPCCWSCSRRCWPLSAPAHAAEVALAARPGGGVARTGAGGLILGVPAGCSSRPLGRARRPSSGPDSTSRPERAIPTRAVETTGPGWGSPSGAGRDLRAAMVSFWPAATAAAARSIAGLTILVAAYGVAATLSPPGAPLLQGLLLFALVAAWLWLPLIRRRNAAMGLGLIAVAGVLALPLCSRTAGGEPLLDYTHWDLSASSSRRDRVLQLESRLRTARLAAEGSAADGRPQRRASLLADGCARPLRRVPLARTSRHAAAVAGAALAFRGRFRRLPQLPLGSHGPFPDRPAEQPAGRRSRHAALDPGAGRDRPLGRRRRARRRRRHLQRGHLQRALLLAPADPDARCGGPARSRTSRQLRRYTTLALPQPIARDGRGPERRPGARRGTHRPAHGALAIVSRRRAGRAAVDRRLLRLAVRGGIPPCPPPHRRDGGHLRRGRGDPSAAPRRLLLRRESTGPALPAARIPVPRSRGLLPAVLRGDGADAEDARHTQPGRIGVQPGTPSEARNRFAVHDFDAHSWVEVYFERIGWVAFDPTPGVSPAASTSAQGRRCRSSAPGARCRRSAPEARTAPGPAELRSGGGGSSCRRWPGCGAGRGADAGGPRSRPARPRPPAPVAAGRRPRSGPDRRAAPRPAGDGKDRSPAGLTLRRLEHDSAALGRPGLAAYAAKLGAFRYGAGAAPPDAEERRRMRRELWRRTRSPAGPASPPGRSPLRPEAACRAQRP